MLNQKKHLRGMVSLVFATILFGSVGILTRQIGTGFGIVFQALARNSIVFLIIAPYLFWAGSKRWKKIKKEDYKWFLAMSIPGLVTLITLFIAFNNLQIGTTLFLFYASQTLIGYLWGMIFFSEKLTRVKTVSLLACILGLLVIFSTSLGGGKLIYVLSAILAGLGVASWNGFSKKVSSKYSLIQILAMDCIISVLLSLPIISILQEPVSLPSLSTAWLAVFGYAIIAIATGLLSFEGFRSLEVQAASLMMLLEPLFGISFAWLVFKEVPTISAILGGVLVLTGVAWPNVASFLEKRKKS